MPHGACALSFGVSRYQMVLVVPDSALHHRAQTRRPWTRNTHHCSACESTKSESKSKPPSSLPRASARRRGHRPTPTWRLGHRPPWRSPCPGRVSPRPRIALLMAAGFPPPSLPLASPHATRHSAVVMAAARARASSRPSSPLACTRLVPSAGGSRSVQGLRWRLQSTRGDTGRRQSQEPGDVGEVVRAFERDWRAAIDVRRGSDSGWCTTNLYDTTPKLANCIEELAGLDLPGAHIGPNEDYSGVWEVVYMPHIYATRLFGRFAPVRYVLKKTGGESYSIMSEGACHVDVVDSAPCQIEISRRKLRRSEYCVSVCLSHRAQNECDSPLGNRGRQNRMAGGLRQRRAQKRFVKSRSRD